MVHHNVNGAPALEVLDGISFVSPRLVMNPTFRLSLAPHFEGTTDDHNSSERLTRSQGQGFEWIKALLEQCGFHTRES